MNLADTALELNPDNEGAAHLKIIASAILHAHRYNAAHLDSLADEHIEIKNALYGAELQPVSLWNAERVSRWLRNDIHLPEYAEAFAKEEVTGQLLLMLTYEDLRNELGVESNLHRKKILRGVELARAEEEEDAIEESSESMG